MCSSDEDGPENPMVADLEVDLDDNDLVQVADASQLDYGEMAKPAPGSSSDKNKKKEETSRRNKKSDNINNNNGVGEEAYFSSHSNQNLVSRSSNASSLSLKSDTMKSVSGTSYEFVPSTRDCNDGSINSNKSVNSNSNESSDSDDCNGAPVVVATYSSDVEVNPVPNQFVSLTTDDVCSDFSSLNFTSNNSSSQRTSKRSSSKKSSKVHELLDADDDMSALDSWLASTDDAPVSSLPAIDRSSPCLSEENVSPVSSRSNSPKTTKKKKKKSDKGDNSEAKKSKKKIKEKSKHKEGDKKKKKKKEVIEEDFPSRKSLQEDYEAL